jgi:hypothetical protein
MFVPKITVSGEARETRQPKRVKQLASGSCDTGHHAWQLHIDCILGAESDRNRLALSAWVSPETGGSSCHCFTGRPKLTGASPKLDNWSSKVSQMMKICSFDVWRSHTGYVVEVCETEDLVRMRVGDFRTAKLDDPLPVVL